MVTCHHMPSCRKGTRLTCGQLRTADIGFRPMQQLADIAMGLRLCRLAGWDQVQRDWERFVSADNGTAHVAFYAPPSHPSSARVGETGPVIGTVATIRYGVEFGWIGMVLVHPDVQGRGVGADASGTRDGRTRRVSVYPSRCHAGRTRALHETRLHG